MAVVVVGVSHHSAPLDIRERLALSSRDVVPLVEALRTQTGVVEGVILSTCNRTEIYFVESDREAASAAWDLLSERLGSNASPHGYVRRDREAAAHLFRVASGIDSMVVGEAQIHGQVRDAWEGCREVSGVVLNRLFQNALSIAGRVRSETKIGHGALSVSSAAVQLSKKIFGGLAGKRAMVLGAGEMAELALASLQEEGVNTAVVANRTFERAQALALQYGALAVHYDEAWPLVADVDLLLCSTASPRPMVDVAHIRGAVEKRGDRPLCILDIALPRDVDPAVRKLDNVFLYDLDDLKGVVTANLERRQRELPAAEALIAGEVENFWQWVAGLSVVPVVTQLREEMNRVRAREVEVTLRRMGELTPDQRAAVEQLAQSLTNKFLHEPSVRLRAAAANGRGLGVVDAARYLFALVDDANAAPAPTDDQHRSHPS